MSMFDYQKSAGTPDVILENVPKSHVFDSKNPDKKVVSIVDPSIKTHYLNITMDADRLTETDRGYSVNLGPETMWREVTWKEGSGFQSKRMDVPEILSLYHTYDQKTGRPKVPVTAEKTEKSGQPAYLNYVSESMVHEYPGNDRKRRVSVPLSQESNSFANLVVWANQIKPAKNRNREVVPGRCNVFLGDALDRVTFTTPDGAGGFQKKAMTAGELQAKWDANQVGYKSRSRQAETPVKSEPVAKRQLPDQPTVVIEDDDMAFC